MCARGAIAAHAHTDKVELSKTRKKYEFAVGFAGSSAVSDSPQPNQVNNNNERHEKKKKKTRSIL